MIDHYRGEVLFSLILEERRREAHRARLLAAAKRRPGPGSQVMAAFGGLVVRIGRRLQRLASPPSGTFTEPCFGCAN